MNRFVVAEPLWCTGCNTCLAACSDVHKTQGLQQHPRLALAKTSTLTAPVVCHHCEEAPCLQVCPVNAISQRDDAIQLNESLCIGCKLCAVVCPFGAISYSAAIFLIPICISFDTAEKRRYATYLILNRRFSFEF